MIGSLNLPIAKGNAKTYIFPANDGTIDPASGTTRGVGHTTWQKPAGINFVYGLLIGPGTGGGGGYSFGAGTAGGGGGGGIPGAVTQFVQPAYLMPDTIIVSVGRGGKGGAAGTAGTLPNNYTTTLLYPTKVLGNTNYGANVNTIYAATTGFYGYSGTQSGRAGSAVAGGNGGSAGGSLGTTQQPGIAGFSNFVTNAALTGFNGGFAAAGTAATFLGRPQGGAGGGGVSAGVAYAGGNVLGPTTSNLSIWSRDLSGGANTGVAGEDGVTLFEPTFFSLPGAGGGATLTGTGGNGGKGGIGCGGGGGGAGPTGGRGGDGGDGLVILVCW